MNLQASLIYRAPDSTQLLNDQLRKIFIRGVYDGGLVTPSASGGLAVNLSDFVAVGLDGVVVRPNPAIPSGEDFAVTAGITQRLLLHVVYVTRGAATLEVLVMTETDWLALSSDEKLEYVTYAQIAPPALATSVASADISYAARDAVDPMSRSPWRAVVATSASLPTPPTAVVRDGDVALALDTFQPWTYTGANGWQAITFDGLVNLLDSRLKIASQSAATPLWEMGRLGLYAPAGGHRQMVAQPPVHPALTTVGYYDADATAGAAVAARAVRKSAAGRVYIKGRSNVGVVVESGDLRIGRLTSSANLVAVVSPGDSDVGSPISPATVVVGFKDSLAHYAYLKVGGNPAIVQATDLRIFLTRLNPARMGLTAGLTAVGGGDIDVGDSMAALNFYSTTGGSEFFYVSTGALTVVAAGDATLRLQNFDNPSYSGKLVYDDRTDTGRRKGLRPDGGSEDSWELNAGTGAVGDVGPYLQLVRAGVASGKLTREQLASLIGGLAATNNPTNAGITIPPLADSLHRHRDVGRGDGVYSGLAPSNGGGLTVNYAVGVVMSGGALWNIAGGSIPVGDLGPTAQSYVYVDGVTDPYVPVVSQTSSAATALATPGNIPIAAVITNGSGAITAIRDLRRFIDRIDDTLIRTIGSNGHHRTLQSAVDWFKAYVMAGQDHGPVEFVLVDDLTIASPVLFAGAHGMVVRGGQRMVGSAASHAGSPSILWGYNGDALDIGGCDDLVLDGLHGYFTGVGGVGSFANSAFIGNASSAVAIGQNVKITNCTTQAMAGLTTNKLRHFVRITSGAINYFTVSDCNVEVTDYGILLPVAATGNYIKILRNTIRHSASAVDGTTIGVTGIYVGAGDDILVDGNIIHPEALDGALAGDGSGFLESINLPGGQRNIATRNSVRFSGTSGGSYGILGNPHYGEISSNFIVSASSGYVGIACSSIDPFKIVGNTVKLTHASAGEGITADCGKTIIALNVVESASTNSLGIDTQSLLGAALDDILIALNQVNMTAAVGTAVAIRMAGTGGQRHVCMGNVIRCLSDNGMGIRVSSNVTGAVVSSNSILGPTAADADNYGIWVDGSNVTVEANRIESIGLTSITNGNAIYLGDNSDQCVVNGNVISNCLRGIRLGGTGHSAGPNTVSVTRHAIDFGENAERITVTGGSYASSASVAVYIDTGCAFLSIAGAYLVAGASQYVLEFVDNVTNNVTISGCNCAGPAGLKVAGNGITISGNSIYTTTGDWINVHDDSTNLSVVGNIASGSGSVFFRIDIALVTRLNFANNTGQWTYRGLGFFLRGTDLKVVNNTIDFTLGLAGAELYAFTVLIECEAVVSYTIQNNTFNVSGVWDPDHHDLIRLRSSSPRSIFSGNTIHWSYTADGGVTSPTVGYAIRLVTGDGTRIEGNTLHVEPATGSGATVGILVDDGVDGIQIVNNSIPVRGGGGGGYHGHGIESGTGAANAWIVSLNRIDISLEVDSTSKGIYLHGPLTNTLITQNQIMGVTTGTAILVDSDVVGCILSMNLISGRSGVGRGIYLNATANAAANVVITGNFINGTLANKGIEIDAAVASPAGTLDYNLSDILDNAGWGHPYTVGVAGTNRTPA